MKETGAVRLVAPLLLAPLLAAALALDLVPESRT
jgi:hypothetical protein